MGQSTSTLSDEAVYGLQLDPEEGEGRDGLGVVEAECHWQTVKSKNVVGSELAASWQ